MEVGMKHEDGGSYSMHFPDPLKAQRAMRTKSVSKLIEIGMGLNFTLRLGTLSLRRRDGGRTIQVTTCPSSGHPRLSTIYVTITGILSAPPFPPVSQNDRPVFPSDLRAQRWRMCARFKGYFLHALLPCFQPHFPPYSAICAPARNHEWA